MTKLSMRDVENLKAAGRYVHAGSLQAALGGDHHYGCHFGMRSTRDQAAHEFYLGWCSADAALRTAALDEPTDTDGPTC